MTNYEIVPITEQHISGFNAAVDSVAREHQYLAFLEGPSMDMTRDFVLENIRDDWPHFVALSEGQIVGWCDITSLHRHAYAHAGVLGVGVIATHRELGIGEALMRTALGAARQRGLTRIALEVRESNKRALALYQKLGFQIEGLHRNAVRIGNKYENQMSMALLFAD